MGKKVKSGPEQKQYISLISLKSSPPDWVKIPEEMLENIPDRFIVKYLQINKVFI